MILTGVLLLAMAVSYLIPKPQYEGVNILPQLEIPGNFAGWSSRDVSGELNLQDDRYNFISDVFARLYQNRQGDQLLFLILDAGNFHNPKVCYTSSGFSVEDMGGIVFAAGEKKFSATGLEMNRPRDSLFIFYWLTIDGKIVSWTGQKVSELWSSLFNRKKAGLMVRIEISQNQRTKAEGVRLGQSFVRDLSEALAAKERAFLFGSQ